MIIGHRLAITAKHLFEEDWDKLERYSVIASQILEGGTVGALWYTEKVYRSPHTDIAILFLSPVKGSESAAAYEWKHAPILSMKPPKVGETIWGFGYPSSESQVERLPDRIRVNWKDKPSITTGEVIEVHDEFRDRGMLKFPCFRTNARFDHGMSGGPVFNDRGELCGLVCSGPPPENDNAEWISYAVSLWPLMGTLLDIQLEGFPQGYSYPFRKLAQLGYVKALNLDCVALAVESDHSVRVGLKKE